MKKIKINEKIIEKLGLSKNESLVFDALLGTQMAITVARVSRKSGVARMTVFDILRRLEKRRLVIKGKYEKRTLWKYKKGLEFLERRSEIDLSEDEVASDKELGIGGEDVGHASFTK